MDQVSIRRVDEAWEEKAREEPVKKTNLDGFAGDSDFGAGFLSLRDSCAFVQKTRLTAKDH